MTRREEYELLLERSRRFYETALMQISKGFYDLAAFSLEQALQLFLKACLLELGLDYPRVHSVRRLLELISEASGREEPRKLLIRFSVELGALEDAYISSRYVPREYTAEEVQKLRWTVEEVIRIVRETACRGSQA